MLQDKIDFDFVVSGDATTLRIVRYGHPDHGKRVRIQRHAYPLYYRKGRKSVVRHYNYSPTDYTRYVISALGYLRWDSFATEPLPLEYAEALNRRNAEQWAAARARHPDFDWSEIAPPQPCKGTAHLVAQPDGEYNWRKVNLPA